LIELAGHGHLLSPGAGKNFIRAAWRSGHVGGGRGGANPDKWAFGTGAILGVPRGLSPAGHVVMVQFSVAAGLGGP